MKSVLKNCAVAALSVGIMFSANAYAKTYKIGVAGPLTGQFAAFGEQLTRGADAAAAYVNAHESEFGFNVKVVRGDDQCKPDQAVSVAHKLSSQGVKAVVGHFCSSSSIPASNVYDEEGILMISPASTNPQFTDQGMDGVFRVCGRDDQQGEVAADFMVNNIHRKRIAVIHDKTTYGQGLADATRSSLKKANGNVVMYEGVNIDDKDLSALVTKIKAQNADAVYYGGLHAQAALLVRQLSDQGSKAIFMSGDGITDKAFAQIAGADSNGVVMTFQADPRLNPGAADMVQAFRDQGYEPEGYTLLSYSAFMIAAESLKVAKGNSIKAAMHMKKPGVSFKTAIGEIGFDKKGDLRKAGYVVYSWIGGEYYQFLK